MNKLLIAGTALVLSVGSAIAQTYNTTPNNYGHPEFGTTTRGPNGDTYQTDPNVYGHPEFGTTTRGPGGMTCQSIPNNYGHPERGTTTVCN